MESALFFLLIAGNKCACGFDSEASIDDAIATDESECNSPCSGNSDENCGGPMQYQLFELFDGPAPTEAPEPTAEPTLEATEAPEEEEEATEAPEVEATDAPEEAEATDAPEAPEATDAPEAPEAEGENTLRPQRYPSSPESAEISW